jgi:hypothetical protein
MAPEKCHDLFIGFTDEALFCNKDRVKGIFQLKYFENDIASFCSPEELLPSLERFCGVIRQHPSCIEPFRGEDRKIAAEFSEGGFKVYPTVKKTTLLYDPASASFLKVLHPLNIKNRTLFFIADRAKSIYTLSERLLSKGVRTVKVVAYGTLKKGRRPFFAVKKAEGESLYDILIRGKKPLPMEAYSHVISEVARLHRLGYWLGDAHLSHIFIKDTVVSGLIDIDSIRQNRPYALRNIAKDMAGLNHPELPLTGSAKKELLKQYIKEAGIGDEKKFIKILKYYTERRWKG